MLREVEGLSTQESADVLDISISAARGATAPRTASTS